MEDNTITISENPSRDEYTSSPGQTVFNYTFKIYANTDLNVYVTPEGQDADDAADISTDYTVDSNTIGDEAGGFITFNNPLADGDRVTISSNIPYDRTVDYQNNGDFRPDTVNSDNDRQVSQIKQIESGLSRTLQFPSSLQNATGVSMDPPESGKYVRWKSDLSGLENVELPAGQVAANGVVLIYPDVPTMKASTDDNLIPGITVATQGYYTTGDGGGALYLIATPQAADEYGDHTLANGNVAVLQVGATVDVRQYGAKGDGVSNDTLQITAAIAIGKSIEFPANYTFMGANIPLVSGAQLIVSGEVKLLPDAIDNDVLFFGDGISGVRITGQGALDGNKANQSGDITTRLINIINSGDGHTVSGITLRNHYSAEAAPLTGRALSILGGNHHNVLDVTLLDWQQEGIFLERTSHSVISGVSAIDNDGASWSGVQISGSNTVTKYNRISDITCFNTGASAVNLDSQYSVINNVTVDTVRFQNGVNLGHAPDKDSSYSVVSNIVVRNITDSVSANSSGLNLSASTVNVSANNITVEGSTQKGINISSGAKNVKLSNIYLKDIAGNAALSVFDAGTVDVTNMEIAGATVNGIEKDSDTKMNLNGVDISGATNKIIGTGAASDIQAVSMFYDRESPMAGGVSIGGLGAGGSVVVPTDNARQFSRIDIQASNNDGAQALPYISTYSAGSFTVSVGAASGGSAFLRWRIT